MDDFYNCLVCEWPCGMCVCPEKMIDIEDELNKPWICDSCGLKRQRWSTFVVVAYMERMTQIAQLCTECKEDLEVIADPKVRYEFTKK